MNDLIEGPFIYQLSFRTYDFDNSYGCNFNFEDKPKTIPEAYNIIEEQRLDIILNLTINNKSTIWPIFRNLAWKQIGGDIKQQMFKIGQELAQATFNKLNKEVK